MSASKIRNNPKYKRPGSPGSDSGFRPPPPPPAAVTHAPHTSVTVNIAPSRDAMSATRDRPSSGSTRSLTGVGGGTRTTVTQKNNSISTSSEDKENILKNNEKKYKLEDFELRNTVGTGTFGRVLLCREKKSNQYYAMKVMNVSDIIRLKQVKHVKDEKAILSQVDHPNIVNLVWTYHDRTFLYMVLEYVPGGELFSYLRQAGKFDVSTSRFFAAEITSALCYLHDLHIIYRDLKPENVLIQKNGHCKITDFGFAKRLQGGRTWTLCGTPEYLAPELIQQTGHDKAVDWWSLGILIFEMLAGYPPFFDEQHAQIYAKIMGGKFEFPRQIDSLSRDIVRKLLQSDKSRRLGCARAGSEEVKQHMWFKNLNWDDVLNQKLIPLIYPKIKSEEDTSNFDFFEEDDLTKYKPRPDNEVKLFDDW